MTHREIVTETLRDFGPLSAYGVRYAARARGHRLTPSSARSRIAELERAGKVRVIGREPTPKRSAAVYQLTR
jgi:hypothetical protein